VKHSSKSEQNTIEFGKSYGEKSRGGDVFLLTGDLGGGKTQFVKGLAQGLGVTADITSPTFTYEKIYQGQELILYHFDLYREEVLDQDIRLLMEEALADPKGITAIEWAERAKGDWPKDYVLLEFEWKGENEREITIHEK
jgi:tRNA threonylcarbamoyladenosine biosynthesis protein TsaE